MSVCSENDCNGRVVGRLLCSKHYQRAVRRGDFTPRAKARRAPQCTEPGCERPHEARGLCSEHYRRSRYQPRPRKVKACSEPDCNGKHRAKSLCERHYKAKYLRERFEEATGQAWQPGGRRSLAHPRTCSEPGCDRKHRAKGLCSLHYERQRPRVRSTQPRRPRERSIQPRRSRSTPKQPTYLVFKNDCQVKFGANWDLEAESTRLLMEDREASGDSYEPNWLTPSQLKGLTFREVYNKNGTPDPDLFEGRVFRAYNPLFGTRPRRPETV